MKKDPKTEGRNPKETGSQKTEIQTTGRAIPFELRISFGFRISALGFLGHPVTQLRLSIHALSRTYSVGQGFQPVPEADRVGVYPRCSTIEFVH